MNILVITQMYSQPDDAGDNKPTKTVNYFVKEWTADGHNVVVMHCPSKFPLAFYVIPQSIKEKLAGRISTMVPPIESRKDIERIENGARIYRLPMLKLRPGSGYSKAVLKKQSDRIISILDKIMFHPDLIMGHFANPSLELVGNLTGHYNAKSSIVFHQDCTPINIEKYRIKSNIQRVKAVGARSLSEAQSIKKVLKLKKEPFICCSGAPNEAVKEAAIRCDKHDFSHGIQFLYVGSLIKRKHVNAVIETFDVAASSSDTLTIIGGGPEETALNSFAERLDSKEQIIFTGRIPRQDVLEKMRDAHVFTLISDGEAYGMVYIEAMLQGCLVIASKGGGFDGIIKDGENGFICPAGDSKKLEQIYKKIRSMTVEERNAIGQQAIDTARQYSEKEVAERYLNDVLTNQGAYI